MFNDNRRQIVNEENVNVNSEHKNQMRFSRFKFLTMEIQWMRSVTS